MSRQLPSRPNLEHLKKQAKDQLQELRQREPSAQLVDAQHAIAREYGFASWSDLKARVESVSPFTGTWSANLVRSQRHPASMFRSATIVFDVDGNDVRITDVVVDEVGREERHVNAIRVDDREHPSPSAGYSLRATWRGPRSLETVGTKDGRTIGGATYTISPDGLTMTISADRQRIVMERVGAE
jgi:hypothetical protein